MDKQAQFVTWLRDQLQPSGAEFMIGDEAVSRVEENGRAGVDGLRIVFTDGDAIEMSIAAGEPEDYEF